MNIDALRELAGISPLFPASDDQREAATIRQFALDNGYTYELSNPVLVQHSWQDYKITPAWLGMVGIGFSKSAYHIISGQHSGYTFRMFLTWDNLANGYVYDNPTDEEKRKYALQQTTGVVRVGLPKRFPHIVLDSNKNDRISSSVATTYRRSQLLQLEGDFANYFDLYAPTGLHVNALTLLAPNMMQILKDHAGLFDVEFYGNEMVLMTKNRLYDPETMALLDRALTEQLQYLTRLMASWNYTPRVQPYDLLKKSVTTGRTLKIGKIRISAGMQLVLIGVGFLLFALLIIILKRTFPES